MKLKDWMNIWLNKYEKNALRLRTFCKYEQTIEKHINPALGEYNLNQLNAQVLQDFVIDKVENGNIRNGRKLAVSTVRNMIALLKRALKRAVKLGYVDKEYTDLIILPRGTVKQVTAFEKDEQKLLEAYCLNHPKRNYMGIIICLYTGIRLGELLALEWSDIDFHKKLMHVNKTVYSIKPRNNDKRIMVVGKPKTKNSNRVIPLSRPLISILRKLKGRRKTKYVLETTKRKVVDERSYQRTYKRILERIGVPYKNFHSLRHTFATRALEMGVDVKTVSELLGHRTTNITLSTYIHSMFTYKIDVMNRLGNALLQDKHDQKAPEDFEDLVMREEQQVANM